MGVCSTSSLSSRSSCSVYSKNPAKRAFEDTIATAGALTSAIQITTLAFDENDGVSQKLAQGVQAIAIAQNVANIVKEKGAIIDTLTLKNFRSLTAVQGAYGVVVGTSTGALKLFRLALAATGIGALIVGLGLLIANFDKVKNSVLSLVAPITDFFGLTSEAGRAQEKLAQDAEKSANAQVKAADELKVSSDNRVKAIDREIALAQASGKSTLELEKKKQREIILTTNSQLQANRALFNALKLKAQNVELTDEEKKKYEELRKTINDQTQAILDASNNINVITANANKEQDDKRKEANDKAIERQKEYQAKLKELNEKFILTERERLIKSFDDELKAITGNGQKEIELRAAISKAKQDAVTKFDNDAKAKEAARIRANELELLQIEEDSLQNRLRAFELGFVDREAKLREQGANEVDIARIKNDGIKKVEEQFAKEQLDIQIKSINDLAALNSTLQENELAAVDLSVATEQASAGIRRSVAATEQQDPCGPTLVRTLRHDRHTPDRRPHHSSITWRRQQRRKPARSLPRLPQSLRRNETKPISPIYLASQRACTRWHYPYRRENGRHTRAPMPKL